MSRITIIIGVLFLTMFNLVGCSETNDIENMVSEYTKSCNKADYESMYELLSKESKEYISRDEFIERYTKIYSGIGVNNFKIEIGEIKDKSKIPTVTSMNTIAGNLKFEDTELMISKEGKEYKVIWDESLILPQMIKNDKVSFKTTNGTRGKILDRDNNMLSYDGDINSVLVNPKIFKETESITNMAQILDIDEADIQKKLSDNTNPEHLVSVVKIANNEKEKVMLVDEINGVEVRKETSRVYMQGEAFGNLIGYTGDISKEELDKNQGKGYTSSSKIGKKGLEEIYEEKLKSTNGVHIYIQRDDEEITIAKTEPKNGEDIKLAIDSKLQEEIYNQMNNEKGASIAMNPKTGEVLAMVSSPSYDSNNLVAYKTKTIAKKYEESGNAEFYNRANDVYSPGSTMKLLTASIGLENNVIKATEEMDIKGYDWQKDSSWGSYKVTRVKDSKKPINLFDAVKYSDNIYFADKAIKIGKDNYIKGCKKFGIGEKIPFEYPMEKSQISNDEKLETEILLGDTGYGQGEVLMSPLDVAMSYSALGNDGNIMLPRLVVSENSEPKVYKEAIKKENVDELTKSFLGVINDEDGSGKLAKIEGISILGKTGTAEIKKDKEDNTGSENGWFVALNSNDSNIVISMIIEDVKNKGGSEYVIPKVKNSIESYLKR